jgi:NAD(P)-dependent dehydrogenase (short-subunit alcohol dehydrogenase family)
VPFGGPLNACKYALAALDDALRLELRPWGIGVVLIEPGNIRTAAYGKLEAAAEAAIGRFGEQGRRHYETAYRTMIARAVEHERSGSPPRGRRPGGGPGADRPAATDPLPGRRDSRAAGDPGGRAARPVAGPGAPAHLRLPRGAAHAPVGAATANASERR